MRTIATLPLLALLAGCVSTAQEFPPPPPPGSEVVSAPTGAAAFNAQQLEQLLAPIALYPDPLLALILPASTDFPELAQAAQFVATGGSVNQVDLQPWDESVRALAHYPQIVRWMAENPAWTQQLGDAFAAQPDNVMSAVQRLRARARAAGTLVDTPQQRVMVDGDTIAIEPASPDVIYVPYYDPNLVYSTPDVYPPSGYFSYSPAFYTGWWLSFGLDWHRRHVWQVERGERERWWREHHGDWNRPRSPQRPVPPEVHPWHPRDTARWHRDDDHERRPGSPASGGPPHESPAPNSPRPGDRRDGWHGRDTNATPTQNNAQPPHPGPTGRWTSTTGTASAQPVTAATPAPAPGPTPAATSPAFIPPRGPSHRDRGGGSVYNPAAPRSTPTYTPPPPAPSATPSGYSNVPSAPLPTVPAMRPLPPAPANAPSPTYAPPPQSNGGWQRVGPTPPAAAPPHRFTPPPPPAAGAAQPQPQAAPPPSGNGDDNRRSHGREQDH